MVLYSFSHSHYYNQEDCSLNTYPSEQFFQTGQCGLGPYQVIESVHRNSFSPCTYLVHVSAYSSNVVLFEIFHGPV